jgi:CheY-like chemotaxis protein
MEATAMKPKKILLADDDLVTRKVLHRMLTKEGFVVVLASDGRRALNILEDNADFDLLITDILMPNMDGRQLIQTLHGDKRFENLPRIIMSATVSIKEISTLLEQGASRFLAKPVNASLLERELAALFS